MAMIISRRQSRLGPLKSTLNYYLYGPHYTPLSDDITVPDIRLVKILPDSSDKPLRCELFRAVLWPVQDFERIRSDFEDRYDTLAYVRYDALSYVWGDTENKVPISVNGKDLMITLNLWLALRRLRKASIEDEWESLYWIDAICINQTNLAERSQQVQLMAQIYSMAQQVVVWLGEEDEQSRVVFRLLQGDWGVFTAGPNPWDEFSQLEAFRSTFRGRSWWRRLWVVQEVCHAQTIQVQCGSKSLEWKTLNHFYKFLRQRWGSADYTGQGPRLFRALEIVGDMEAWRLRSRKSNSEGMVSPEEAGSEVRNLAVEIFGQRECTDPRDAIYGLLSISPLLAFVVPDYNLSKAGVYISAAKAIISIRQDFDILSRVQRSNSKPAQRSRREKVLPSWVPDWSTKMEYEDILSLAAKGKPYQASGDKKMPAKTFSEHNDQILLDGIFWDRVTNVSELHWAGNSGTGFSGDEHAGDGLRDFMQRLARSERGLRGWSAFTTKTGSLGLVLGDANVGDMVYIAYGSRVPLLLRTFGDESALVFSLMGTVYCEAIMYGGPVKTMRMEYYAPDEGESSSWVGRSLFKWKGGRDRHPKLLVKDLFEEEIRLV